MTKNPPHLESRIEVRPYTSADRANIRTLCADTADAGEPVEHFFPDRILIADLVTRYHTDFEPKSTRVAVDDGHVVGYLTGCLRPQRFHRLMRYRIVPAAVARAVVRGTLMRRST